MLARAYFLFGIGMLAASTPLVAQLPEAAPASAEAAARLPAATKVMDRLWPAGSYLKMMNGTMQRMTDAVMDQMLQVRASEVDPKGAAQAGDQTLAEVIAKKDPAFRERVRITNEVMFAEMMPMIERAEPKMRAAMARIFARKFDAQQLAELDRFLATPTGEVFAREWLVSFMDPEVMAAMQSFAPDLMQALPAIMKKVEAATSHLPPPPKPKNE